MCTDLRSLESTREWPRESRKVWQSWSFKATPRLHLIRLSVSSFRLHPSNLLDGRPCQVSYRGIPRGWGSEECVDNSLKRLGRAERKKKRDEMEVKSDVAFRQVSFRREGNQRQMRKRPRAERGEDDQLGRPGQRGWARGKGPVCSLLPSCHLAFCRVYPCLLPPLVTSGLPPLATSGQMTVGCQPLPAGLTCVSGLLGLVLLVSPRHKQLPHRLLLAALILLCSLRAVLFGWWSSMRSPGHSQPSLQ